TRSGNAGPVHFDIPLREPLVPEPGGTESTPPGRGVDQPWTATQYATLDVPLEIDLTPDTVVISGHGAGLRAELADLPTVAEPTAPVHGPALHPLALPLLKPRQAIITGRPTLHRQVSKVLADPEVTVYALTTGPRWPDVSGNVVGTGTRAVTSGAPTAQWLDRCRELDRRARHPTPTGRHVAAVVTDALRGGDQLLLGASSPVRDAALVAGPTPGVRVLSNRGVAGIDGTVSSAVGAALHHRGRTIALIGDL